MKIIKSLFLSSFLSMCFFAVNAQSTDYDQSYDYDDTENTSDEVGIPDSYMQEQDQLDEEYYSGTASYNIDDSDTETAYEESSWRSESEGEELRVYSGFQDGNNVIKTINVPVPESMQNSSIW